MAKTEIIRFNFKCDTQQVKRKTRKRSYIILDIGFHADGTKDLLSGLHRQIVIKVEHSLLPVSVRRLWAYKKKKKFTLLFNCTAWE